VARSNCSARLSSANPSVGAYQRNAAAVTDRTVLPPHDGKQAEKARGLFRRREPEAAQPQIDHNARAEAEEVLVAYDGCVQALRSSLAQLSILKSPRLLGKVEEEQRRIEKVADSLHEARGALQAGDLSLCGKAVQDAHRQLASVGEQLWVVLNTELSQAALTRDKKETLETNLAERRAAQEAVAEARKRSVRAGILAAASLHSLAAEGFALAAEVLSRHSRPVTRRAQPPVANGEVQAVPPHELEDFSMIGGLEEVKYHLRRTIGTMLERPAEAARSGATPNGVLLYGPPGTGKTLLARAVAGEYGLRFIRLSPAAIASPYQHEPARKLRQIFARAAESTPCVLFLDEVETIAARREGLSSPDQRELVIQLLDSLEEYRQVPGLVIMAATNMLDHLDPALREGRFDSRIAIPLPDIEARKEILSVLLEQHPNTAWDTIDLDGLAERTSGRSGAALAALVAGAAQRALGHGGPLRQADVMAELEGRSGQDRAQTVQDPVYWDDVVLPEATRQRLNEILLLFQRPDLGRQLGVRPPAGILLYGPPGTGKTTIAKALATEGKASFYEQSAADLLSKWVGESEQQVSRLFTRARNNRPSIIFCDEIDAVLKRRSNDSSAPWEERVVSQFLRELDGLHSGEGVLLVGATNRLDIIDEAIRERRLVPIEVPLPDAAARAKLLQVLFRDVRLGPDVDLDEMAEHSEGMSGADLKALRDSAGMKALSRAARAGDTSMEAALRREDFVAALGERGLTLEPRPKRRTLPQPTGSPKKQTPTRRTAGKRASGKGK
jgi:transitional endoplasmic reticulum ATPase